MLTPVTGGVLVFQSTSSLRDLGGGALVLLVKLETKPKLFLCQAVSLFEMTFPNLITPPLMTVCYQEQFSFGVSVFCGHLSTTEALGQAEIH